LGYAGCVLESLPIRERFQVLQKVAGNLKITFHLIFNDGYLIKISIKCPARVYQNIIYPKGIRIYKLALMD